MAGTFFNYLDPGASEFHEFFGFEADVLVTQVTGHLVRDALLRLPELRGQRPVFLEPHQVLTDVERAFGQRRHVARRHQVGIFPFEHETATGGGDDEVVPLLEIW